ncbi:MAG: ubiquitin-like protein Pup [Actinomycetota bacterium]|nr:ubiquitin-like protein Pup [Actinomycetota bacterium]MDH5277845.1 ubiquitin-like protein Pup [Actinomycetota bacterium]
MSTRDTGGQQRAERRSDDVADAPPAESEASDVAQRHEAVTEDVDALLDEIDDVLEENAEEFVKSFVQKGGQ